MANAERVRRHERIKTGFPVNLTWTDPAGNTVALEGRGLDVSRSGILVICGQAIAAGSPLYVQASRYSILGQGHVRRCQPRGGGYALGIEFTVETAAAVQAAAPRVDYYELLQINRHADQETIQRVFRIMAARFHPDNRETGDRERFIRLKEAYDTLNDPVARAQYDATHNSDERGPLPIFELRDFVDDVPGELNRRLGVLCLLYNHRRRDPDRPGLSVLQLEQLMSFPREYLTFAIWFLHERGYIRMTDNSDYALTAGGAEYVESKVPSNRLAVALLCQPATAGAEPGRDSQAPEATPAAWATQDYARAIGASNGAGLEGSQG